jgi:O-antigen ligase
MAGDVSIIVILLRTGSVRGVSHALIKGFIASTCLLALLAWIMPAQQDLRLGDEEYFNTNQIGNLCAFGIFFAQYLVRRKDGRWGATIFFLSLTLLRSLSKTTIVAFLLSEGILVVLDKSISKQAKLLLAVAVMVAVVVFWGLFEAYYDIYTTTGNQAETLTGRTGIWAYVLTAALEQPWIGHGFDSMWKIIPPFGPDRFEARHAENELLTQFYAYGVFGVCMLIGVYSSLLRQIGKLRRGPVKMVLLCLLVFILIRGLAEAEPFDLLLPLWAIVLLSLLVEDARFAGDAFSGGLSPTEVRTVLPGQIVITL